MEDDAPVIYGLEFQARALTPQTAETDAIRFLVGTQSLKYDNQHLPDCAGCSSCESCAWSESEGCPSVKMNMNTSRPSAASHVHVCPSFLASMNCSPLLCLRILMVWNMPFNFLS
uniref:EARP complex and GARP complex interacting protein 1 n=1 Tax=Equus caballus TaxID=9796 RepID=A0A9L0R9N4_HORSE